MGVFDIYYRAFKGYRRETADNNSCEKDRRAISKTDVESDRLETTKYLCHIEEDWINAIDEGLVYVENAVQEERQFIRTNGEVVPIEKVKRISKDSVEHLAKHSEMITHVPEEDEQIIPDKLYMVEKLSDYAVYENRFLYMLLCYLRDFINFRLEKIETLRSTYKSDFSVSKEIVTKKRTLIIKSEIREERTDNPYPIADAKSVAVVQKIKDCQQIVMSLLNTDLMVQVAKSPMIKPPIVKTNVLKMNNNFKHALALYDFIASYKGDGFSYEEVKNDLAPYGDKLADEIAEALNLTSFTAYKFGNDIEDLLETAYREEENRREEEQAKKLEERVKRLKKRALESGKTLEEYMLVLEERNRMLEKGSEELAVIRQKVEELTREINGLNDEKKELIRRIEALENEIEEKEREIAALKQKYIDDMAALKKQHGEEIVALNAEHENSIVAFKAEFAEKLESTIDEYEGKLSELSGEIEKLNIKHEETVEEYEQKIVILNEKAEALNAERKKTVDECELKIREIEEKFKNDFDLKEKETAKAIDEMKQETLFVRSQLDGIRVQQGHLTPSTDHSSRERFIELQAEYAAFEKFFKEQWKLTKKQIRKQVLWAKPESKKRGKDRAEEQVIENKDGDGENSDN